MYCSGAGPPALPSCATRRPILSPAVAPETRSGAVAPSMPTMLSWPASSRRAAPPTCWPPPAWCTPAPCEAIAMSARLLLLCPGQGGQHPGMNALAAADPAAARLLAQAPLPDGALFDNRVAQPVVEQGAVRQGRLGQQAGGGGIGGGQRIHAGMLAALAGAEQQQARAHGDRFT